MPFFSEATQSAARIVQLQSQRLKIQIEERTRREVKRGMLLALAAVFLQCGLLLASYWITQRLHDQGWSPDRLAGAASVVFGVPALILIFIAQRQPK